MSFDIDDAETVALVGESGCGKSTTGLATIRLIEPTSGTVSFESKNLLAADSRELRSLRADLQIVFQDPRGQLDSRMRVASTVGEPLRAHRMGNRTERRDRTAEVLETVGLGKAFLDRYPHQLSGGQRQRVAI
ncbi:MAG: ATP-binding cassette domain-containing protein, partial [Actinomycetota bacterium]